MQIIRNKKYLKKIQSILSYIAEDSIAQAIKFQSELDKGIDDLVFMPYKCRKSIYFDNDYIRDFIFKKYIIVYKIDMQKDHIIIVGINKYQKHL